MRRLAILVAILAGCFASPPCVVEAGEGLAAEGVSLAEILPPETLVYLRWPSKRAAVAEYRKTIFKRIAAQPQMATFLKDYDGAREEFVQYIAKQATLQPAFVRSLLAGRLSGALVDLHQSQKGVDVSWVFAVHLDHKPDRAQLFKAIKAIANKPRDMSGQALPIQKVAYEESWPGDHKILVILSESPYRCVLLDKMILFYQGPKADGLKAILAHYDNRLAAKTLSKSPLFRAAHRGADAKPSMSFLYVNTNRLYTLLGALRLPRFVRLLNALGMNSVQAVGCAGGFHGEGIRHTMYAYSPGERRGILKALSFKPNAEQAARELPDGAWGLVAARVDLASFYREVPRLVDAVEQALGIQTPMGLAKLAGQQTILGVPATEVMATLGDAILIEPGPGGTAVRFDTARTEAFRGIIARMEKTLGARFTDLPVKTPDGRTVTVRYFNRSGQPIPLAPSYCISRTRPDGKVGVVYIATHPQVITSILTQNAERSLVESPDFRRVSSGMSKGYGVFMYLDNRDSYPRVYDAVLPILNVWTAAPIYSADPGLLPAGHALAPFAFGCGMGIKNDPEGITCTSYGPLGMGGYGIFLLDKLLVNNPTALGWIGTETARWFGQSAADAPSPLDGPEVDPAPKTKPKTDSAIPDIGG